MVARARLQPISTAGQGRDIARHSSLGNSPPFCQSEKMLEDTQNIRFRGHNRRYLENGEVPRGSP